MKKLTILFTALIAVTLLLVSWNKSNKNKANKVEGARHISESFLIDFQPGSCPSTLNIGQKGIFHVAIVGSAVFNVNSVNLLSVNINGVHPLSSSYQDQVTSLGHFPQDCDDCVSGLSPDGYTDLILKFKTQDVVPTLGNPADGTCITVCLVTNVGTGCDRVRILSK